MAFAKGHKLSVGNKGGAPPKFKDPDVLASKIDEYFNGGCNIRKVVVGKAPNQQVVEIPVPTISGLAKFLGFESRQSFYDYEKVDKFSYVIKRARLFIEVEYEEQLTYGNTTGAIFALKNMGWRDKTETDITTAGEKLSSDAPVRIIFE